MSIEERVMAINALVNVLSITQNEKLKTATEAKLAELVEKL